MKNEQEKYFVFRHSWINDPFTLGGYSFPSTNSTEADYEILMDPEPSKDNPRVFLAGNCHNYLNLNMFSAAKAAL